MDSFGSDRKLSELGDLDLQDFLDQSDLFGQHHQPITSRQHIGSSVNNDFASFKVDGAMIENGWLDNLLYEQTPTSTSGSVNAYNDDIVLNTDIDSMRQPQHVKSEHSYSLANGTTTGAVGQDILSFNIKMEPDEMDMDAGLFGLINPDLTIICNESDASTSSAMDEHCGVSDCVGAEELHAATVTSTSAGCGPMRSVFSGVCSASDDDDSEIDLLTDPDVKTEPIDLCAVAGHDDEDEYSFSTIESNFLDVNNMLDLPPTPPSSSTCSSDSEAGELSPRRSAPSSPLHVPPYHTRTQLSFQSVSSSSTQHSLWTSSSSSNSPQPLFTSPIPSSGILVLTEEERRTLVAEGYPIPTKLPLTKQEEKNLKKIRRKIKNKISAQESRRKKKEYLEHLEKRVEFVSMENITLRKKLDALESNNKSLASQLQKLQSLASRVTAEMQAATCIAVN
jgi:cyclic AMP-responsive element-binding protein 3